MEEKVLETETVAQAVEETAPKTVKKTKKQLKAEEKARKAEADRRFEQRKRLASMIMETLSEFGIDSVEDCDVEIVSENSVLADKLQEGLYQAGANSVKK